MRIRSQMSDVEHYAVKGRKEARLDAPNVDAGWRFADGIAASITGFTPAWLALAGATAWLKSLNLHRSRENVAKVAPGRRFWPELRRVSCAPLSGDTKKMKPVGKERQT